MIRRLLLIMVAATQIAALPLTIEPREPEIGKPITISISLAAPSAELVGFPDLGSFALLSPPEQTDTNVLIRLLPLRPGIHELPALSFQNGQHRVSTEPVTLTITSPPLPDRPHPLKPLPEPELAQCFLQQHLLWMIVVGFALTGMMITIIIRIKRIRSSSTPLVDFDLDAAFSRLASEIRLLDAFDQPEWQHLYRQLEKARFAPLSCSQGQLQELTEEFDRLRGKTS